MSLDYKINLDQKKVFLTPELVSHLIDDISADDFQQKMTLENANPNTTSFLHEKLNDEVQSFSDYFNIFTEDCSIQNENYLLDSLKKLKKSLVLFRNIYENPKFNLSNFPYQDIYQLILAGNNLIIINLSFECITAASKIDSSFDVSLVPEPIIEKLVLFISDCAERESIEIVEFVSTLIQYSPQLCDLFISNGLFHIFDNWIQDPICIYCLESVIMTIDSQHIPTILVYCNELLTCNNRKIVEKSFHCFILFIMRFGFNSIDSTNISSLYEIIPNYAKDSKNVLELCLQIPNDVPRPPDILPIILDTLKDPTIESRIHVLMLSLMIHFYSFWQNCLTKEYISEILFFGAEHKEFETSIKFAECAIFYHKFDDFPFDMSIFLICLDYLESEIHQICIFKIYEILKLDGSRFPQQISEMLDRMTSDVIEIIEKYSNGSESANSEESNAASLILELISGFSSHMDE